jgi:hypothetical protein
VQFEGIPPVEAMWLSIYKIHAGESEYRITWQGRVRNAEFKGNRCTLTLDNILASTKTQAFRQLFQGQCNNFMYDVNCGLSEALFSVDVTVDSVDGSTVTFTAPQAAGFYQSGQLKRANGDRRFVVSDTVASGEHTVELLTPFEDLQAGEVIVAIGGACRHSFDTCQAVTLPDGSTEDNSANYGGYPKVPRKNPFRSFH